MDSVRDGNRLPRAVKNIGHRVMTNVFDTIYESILTKGKVFAIQALLCRQTEKVLSLTGPQSHTLRYVDTKFLSPTGTDSRILRYDTEGQPEFWALRRGADEDPH